MNIWKMIKNLYVQACVLWATSYGVLQIPVNIYCKELIEIDSSLFQNQFHEMGLSIENRSGYSIHDIDVTTIQNEVTLETFFVAKYRIRGNLLVYLKLLKHPTNIQNKDNKREVVRVGVFENGQGQSLFNF